ncbi:MAG TPA: DUF4129 domain-containing protein [Ktedonobacteraceae bacterium]|nr:DUF4129 domain-containing protein [Ktedonobacteraceae bacterium]
MDLAPRPEHENEQSSSAPPRRDKDESNSYQQSLGEYLLPFFIAAMDTCWIAAVLLGQASISFMQHSAPVLPLWAPFIFIAGTYWIVRHSATAATGSPTPSAPLGLVLVGALIVLTLLYCIWSGVYASTAAFFNPAWLLLWLNNILSLSSAFLTSVGIIIIALLCAWRGRAIALRDNEPGSVFRALGLGLAMFIVVIFVATFAHSQGSIVGQLFIMIPLFLAFALVAHSLAHIVLLRHSYSTGLSGSVVAQESSLFVTLGGLCVALFLFAFAMAAIVSPTFLTETQQLLSPIGQAYDWLVRGLAWVLSIILSPLFYLLQLIKPRGSVQPVKGKGPATTQRTHTMPPSLADIISRDILTAIMLLFIVGIIIFVIVLIFRRRRMFARKRQQEQHESIWSWELFWSQLMTLWLALKQHFFPRHAVAMVEANAAAEMPDEPAARDIREMYRALLRRASSRGYARRSNETPHEFHGRLSEQVPPIEPPVARITAAYMDVRYGGTLPAVEEVEQVREDWQNVQQNI